MDVELGVCAPCAYVQRFGEAEDVERRAMDQAEDEKLRLANRAIVDRARRSGFRIAPMKGKRKGPAA